MMNTTKNTIKRRFGVQSAPGGVTDDEYHIEEFL